MSILILQQVQSFAGEKQMYLRQVMTNPIARRPGLVKCDQIYIRDSKFSDKHTMYHKRASDIFYTLFRASALQNYLSSPGGCMCTDGL
jgi:hypothetical protein